MSWHLSPIGRRTAIIGLESSSEKEDAAVTQRYDVHTLPEGLPVPTDDGACDHLAGIELPAIPLNATDGGRLDLSAVSARAVVYIYPRTGRPDEPGSAEWDAIPGARGCTPQSCGFRDHYAELRGLGVAAVFGLSTQSTGYQREVVERLHLPFVLLSDRDLALTTALDLPTFEFEPYGSEQRTLLKRMAWIVRDGRIEEVFYPVFPPDRNATDVIAWLSANPI
jgi:peroxiredoxin